MAVLLLAVAVPGQAQESDSADRWRANAQLGFNGASGNTAFSILTAGASLNHLNREFFEFDLSGQFRYGTNDDRVIANDTEVTAKFDYHPEADLSPFVFGTIGRDVIRNVDGRAIGGGGAKWTFWRHGTSTKMSVSAAAVAEHENYRLDAGSVADESITVARWSGRVKFDHTFGSGATYQHITFWQPRVDRVGDYVVNIANTLSASLISGLSLVVSHSYIHDEVPPPGAVRDDTRLTMLLRVGS